MALATGLGLGLGILLVPLAVLGAVLVALLLWFGLGAWVAVLLGMAVLVRVPVTLLDLPEAVDFSYFAGTALLVVVGVHRALRAGRLADVAVPMLFTVSFVVVAVASGTLNGTHPLRTMLFLALMLQPALVLVGTVGWPGGAGRTPVWITGLGALAVLEIAMGAWQRTFGFSHDEVVGTFLDHKAGAHIYGALLGLGLCLLVGLAAYGRLSRLQAVVLAVPLAVMLLLADAKQVAFALGAGLVAALVLTRSPGRARLGRVRRSVLVGVALLVLGAGFTVRSVAPGFFNRAVELVTPESSPVTITVRTAMEREFDRVLVGTGPGAGSSRASLLLTPAMMRPGSPVRLLGLEPTSEAVRYSELSLDPRFGGSVERFGSSLSSFLIDTGVLGLAVWLAFFLWLVIRLRRVTGWLQYAATAALVMLFGLSLVDFWFEIPEITIPLFLMVGLALRREAQQDAEYG